MEGSEINLMTLNISEHLLQAMNVLWEKAEPLRLPRQWLTLLSFFECFVLFMLWFSGWFGLRGGFGGTTNCHLSIPICVLTCVHAKHKTSGILCHTLSFCLETGSLNWVGSLRFSCAGWPVSSCDPPISAPMLGFQEHTTMSSFLYGSWEPKLRSSCLESKFYYQLSHVFCPKAHIS